MAIGRPAATRRRRPRPSFWSAWELGSMKKMDKIILNKTLAVHDQFADIVDKGFLW